MRGMRDEMRGMRDEVRGLGVDVSAIKAHLLSVHRDVEQDQRERRSQTAPG